MKDLKFVVSAIGDPFSSATYSGVPFNLFSVMDEEGLIVKRVNGKRFSWPDILSGFYRPLLSLKHRKRYPNSLWRYKQSSGVELSKRLEQDIGDAEFDVFLQIGCGGLPTRPCIRVAHVEIPLHACMSDPVFAASYGFKDRSPKLVEDALAGEAKFLAQLDLVWTNTEWTSGLLQQAGVPKHKIFVYPPCVKQKDRKYRPRTLDNLRVLFIGKDWERKGGPSLVTAFDKLRAEHPQAELHIVGCTPELPPSENVFVHGFLDKSNPAESAKFNELLDTSNIFCMPSAWESTGIVYFEALQNSIPVLMVRGQGREDLFAGMAHIIDDNSAEQVYLGMKDMIDNYERSEQECMRGYQAVKYRYNYSAFVRSLCERVEKI